MALVVKFAVYGGLRNGNQDSTEAANVRNALQAAINNSSNGNGVVRINNSNMGGDPAVGVVKHFAAIVEVDGVDRPFACQENQIIDFS